MSEPASLLAAYVYEVQPRTRCATPGCRRKPGHGDLGIWCPTHAANLARIREEIAAMKTVFKQRSDQRAAHTHRPRCCTPGCDEPRPRGETFCAVCRVMDGDLAA